MGKDIIYNRSDFTLLITWSLSDMIEVGDVVKVKRKYYRILSIFSDPLEPNKIYYAAKTTISKYPSFCILTRNAEGNLFVHS